MGRRPETVPRQIQARLGRTRVALRRPATSPPCSPYNYSANAGLGSDNFAQISSPSAWRSALLGTVAAGALWIAVPRGAQAGPDDCDISGGGTIATCTGDQSDGVIEGVDFDSPPVTTLNVNSLAAGIEPYTGPGIYFVNTNGDDLTLNSDTGDFEITTVGNATGIIVGGESDITVDHAGDIDAGAYGIHARSYTSSPSGSGAVDVTFTGDIVAGRDGIYALSRNIGSGDAGPVTVTSTGNLEAAFSGIRALSHASDGSAGHVAVTSTGDITVSEASPAIFAESTASGDGESAGGVTVMSTGNLSSTSTGILGSSTGEDGAAAGHVSITSIGGITANTFGISAVAEASGDANSGGITVTSTGDIGAGTHGIQARSNAVNGTTGTVRVDSTGNIAASNGNGIFAGAYSQSGTAGDTNVYSTGDISAGVVGIYAYSSAYDGGTAGAVLVENTGNVAADLSHGIIARSYVYQDGDAGDIRVDTDGNIEAHVGNGIRASSFVYGDGTADEVTVESQGNIRSDNSTGIYAGSVVYGEGDTDRVQVISTGDIDAGNRGIYAYSYVKEAGNAGPVEVTSTGNVVSEGDAITAYSYTGGGGDSGDVTVTSAGNVTSDSNTAIRVESFVAGDGNAGDVTVTSNGAISADDAYGIFARSIVLGQGNAGTVEVTSTGGIESEGVGIHAISNAANGSSDDVTVTSVGAITTAGNGIFAASTATPTGGDSGDVTVTSTGDITSISGVAITATSTASGNGYTAGAVKVYSEGTIGASGSGIVAQSTALNGADAGGVYLTSEGNISSIGTPIFALSQAIGGGNAGDVTVRGTGDISASVFIRSYSSAGDSGDVKFYSEGNLASDVNVASVAAGAGHAGDVLIESIGNARQLFALSHAEGTGNAGLVTIDSTGDIGAGSPLNNGLQAMSLAAGGSAGNVEVTSRGQIQATGGGIVAYSEGATGAGTVQVNSTGDIDDAVGGIVARSEATETDAMSGAVDVSSTGAIVASGTSTFGIIAQSTADGASGPVTVNVAGSIVADIGIYAVASTSGSTATAGDVTVNVTGDINALGTAAILAQSTGTNTGDVTVNVTGDINALGTAAIIAQSYGTNTGDIEVNIDGGAVSGNIGVAMQSEGTNTLTVGEDGTLAGWTVAIAASGGENAVKNYGTIGGNVGLGTGTNSFVNYAGALFNTGSLVDLSAGNLLTNAGTLSPGGIGSAPFTTAITGDLTQTATGIFAVDVVGADADTVEVSGNATLAGNVQARFASLNGLAGPYLILTAATLTDNGLTEIDTAAVDYSLLFDGNELSLVIDGIDFAPDGIGLNRNQRAIAQHFDEIFSGPGVPANMQTLFDALANLPVADYRDALDLLSPEIYAAGQAATVFASLGFTDALMSCRFGAGVQAVVREDQCLWLRAGGRALNQDRTSENIGWDETNWQLALGGQTALADKWRLGLALSYENAALSTNTGATSEGDRIQAGAVLKHIDGPNVLAAAISGGHGSFDTRRRIEFMGFSETARAEHDITHVTGRLHAAHLFDWGGLYYAKPQIDLNATWLRMGAVNERGGGAALRIGSQDGWIFSVSPAIEFGMELGTAPDQLVRPFLRLGATWIAHNDLGVHATFADTPEGVSAFSVRSEMDDVFADVTAGIDFLQAERASLRVSYGGRFGSSFQEHSGSMKASWRF